MTPQWGKLNEEGYSAVFERMKDKRLARPLGSDEPSPSEPQPSDAAGAGDGGRAQSEAGDAKGEGSIKGEGSGSVKGENSGSVKGESSGSVKGEGRSGTKKEAIGRSSSRAGATRKEEEGRKTKHLPTLDGDSNKSYTAQFDLLRESKKKEASGGSGRVTGKAQSSQPGSQSKRKSTAPPKSHRKQKGQSQSQPQPQPGFKVRPLLLLACCLSM